MLLIKILFFMATTFLLTNLSIADEQRYVSGVPQYNQSKYDQSAANRQPEYSSQPTRVRTNQAGKMQTYANQYANSPQANPWKQPLIKSGEGQTQTVQSRKMTGESNYQQQAKMIWFKNCLGSVGNGKAARYANEFCACGWKHISNPSFPLQLLTSTSPVDRQKMNRSLQTILQICQVSLLAQHNKG